MNEYYRAIAIDYDGTLTDSGAPANSVLDAVADARGMGLRVVLVTGRILDELRHAFPAVDEHFDAVVGENGAVVAIGRDNYVLSDPVEPELDAALAARSATSRRGQVLLATQVRHENAVQDAIHALGLDCQLVRNRHELMVLPPGVSKGTGLARALEMLEVSCRNAIGIGDAENDHSLLAMCEFGVAVGNAVDGLKRHADLVLDTPDGAGVVALIEALVHDEEAEFRSPRRNVVIGQFADGGTARIPSAQINLLVTGRSKSGKSFAAGAIAEQLIESGYSVCVIDPEGDYSSLATVHGVECLGTTGSLPDVDQVRRFVKHHLGSVVVDLSLFDRAEHAACIESLLRELEQDRKATGLPHWIIIDEAHHALGLPGALDSFLDSGQKGLCLVTYQPQVFGERLVNAIDFVLAVPGGKRLAGPDPLAELERMFDLPAATATQEVQDREALLISVGDRRDVRRLQLVQRRTTHVRHRHKYMKGELPDHLHFVFRASDGKSSATATNVQEFCDLARDSTAAAVDYHARRNDFSRWISMALQEQELATTVSTLENRYIASHHTAMDLATLSRALVRAITNYYA